MCYVKFMCVLFRGFGFTGFPTSTPTSFCIPSDATTDKKQIITHHNITHYMLYDIIHVVYIYIYTYIHSILVITSLYIYIHTYYTCMCIYIYIYIYIHT